MPWQSGMTGIAYNEKLTSKPITSMEQILTDPALKGKVTLLNEMADTVGLVMLLNGDDPAEVTDDSFDAAISPHPGGRGQRPDPPVHRQRLHAGRSRRAT